MGRARRRRLAGGTGQKCLLADLAPERELELAQAWEVAWEVAQDWELALDPEAAREVARELAQDWELALDPEAAREVARDLDLEVAWEVARELAQVALARATTAPPLPRMSRWRSTPGC